MSVLNLIENASTEDRIPSVSELGGIEAVRGASESLADSPFLDVICAIAQQSSPTEARVLHQIVLNGLAATSAPLCFREAVEVLIRGSIHAEMARRLAKILVDRVETRHSGSGLIAAYALEALLRLAIKASVSRHRLLALLVEIQDEEPGDFARHAAKVAGVAFQLWCESELLEVLRRLSSNPEAADEAFVELGLSALKAALAGSNREAIIAELRTAREFLLSAVRENVEREDAVAYGSAIDIILGFATNAPVDDTERRRLELRASLTRWTAWRERRVMPDWLRARADIDSQWAILIEEVQNVAKKISRPSWINASAVLEQVIAVYDADQSVSLGPGFQTLVRPRIEAAFVERSGLRAHLDDALDSGILTSVSVGAARALRDRLHQLARDGESPGKAKEVGRYSRLAAVLEDDRLIESLAPEVAQQIEVVLAYPCVFREAIGHPVVRRLFQEVRSSLASSSYYQNEVKGEFDYLTLQVLAFCRDRLDASTKERGERGRYLRDPKATEWQLQADLREFLQGNCPWADVRTEVDGVSTGRADIYVTTSGLRRYVVELKREFTDSSRSGLRKYLEQTISYQATNIPLGFLGVLDLTTREGPAPHLATNVWADTCTPAASDTRHVVVFRVIGNLVSPSSFSA